MTLKEKIKLLVEEKKIGQHIKDHKNFYVHIGINVGVAGITALIMRGVASQPISVAIGDAADSTIGGIGKKVVMNNVSFISANRRGSPSWVVRCLETDEVFTSQRKAALAMSLPQDHLSNHLNGLRDHVNDLHFERICLAA